MADRNEKEKLYLKKEESVENIQDLRTRTFSENSEPDLKKSLFGGYDSKEVNDYIRNLSNQHNRTVAAYQERIDEFTTYIEMLNKEKEDIIKNFENSDEEIAKLKSNCNVYARNESAFRNEIERLNSEIAKISSEYTEKLKDLESEFGVSKENELLKEELNAVAKSRDDIQSENSSIKAELDAAKEDIDKLRAENKKLRDEIALISSQMRKYRMGQSVKIIEFSEKEIFTLKKTGETLKNLLDDVQKMTDDTINLKKITGEDAEN